MHFYTYSCEVKKTIMETKNHFLGALLCFLVLRIDIINASSSEEDEETSTSLYATVGSHIAFNCEIEFPNDIEIPYELRWNKDVSSN